MSRGGNRTLIDLTDKEFGRLRVIRRAGTSGADGQGRPTWLCQCECGNQTIVIGANLRAGLTRSCGCLRRENCGRRKKGEKP